ncbi:MAG: YlbF family regulator [Akkermansiaceae bacterium]|nr:YlbF family regulator [Verrucomicrobiales bacterium]
MQTTIEETLITQKTKELCQAILDQPDMRDARQAIESFIGNDAAKSQYESLMAKGQALQQKQQRSEQLSPDEISAFESDREALLNNPVAKGFLDAQQELHEVHETINQYVSKTLELGRIPTDADFESGSCGHGCGCHSEGADHGHSH